ncbi:MAG: MotA/TolQ/ExbB proton channel family protein [Syntrophales bacterium]|nr:MotA/TolQ/ExbB proton channel family protein [Syntrophales bacterium]MDD5231816.1 MotA/TolQ/ExbB proton channel family protein [Syntrophales bacterium]MDD5531202.1 MotA/TolQ/ExbB proton channel family protein [Syntrophales bacterium]HPL62835.1 MotA/TolQ/ExbB proton channel family protein [Syntrophales bacterium]
MDLATIFGIFTGFGLVIAAMLTGGGLSWFVDTPAAMIVGGGTLGALLINYSLGDIFRVLNVAKNAFLQKGQKVEEVIEQLLAMSRLARKEGILSLQKISGRVRDPFFRKGTELVMDGVEPNTLSHIMETELDSIAERHRLGAEIFTSLGNFAPAMGMTGTLIGLVKMLMQMNDPSSIGPSMSMAFVATFYGVVLANLVFLPIAGKLKMRSSQELLVKQLIIGGIMSIQMGDNPRVLEQKLQSYISPVKRKTIF